MTASCAAMTPARLASIASSQLVMKESGSSATPSRDNSSYTTTLRTLNTSGWLTRCCVDGSRSQNSSVAGPLRGGGEVQVDDAVVVELGVGPGPLGGRQALGEQARAGRAGHRGHEQVKLTDQPV